MVSVAWHDVTITTTTQSATELTFSSVPDGPNGFHLNFSDSSTNEALGFDSAPTIGDTDPKKGFDVITYTGNGASTPEWQYTKYRWFGV